MMTHIPRSGRLRLDGRSVSPHLAVARVRALVRRLRRPVLRQLDVLVDRPAVAKALTDWAREHEAPFAVAGDVVRLYLLPDDFGQPPRATLRELETLVFDDVTEIDGTRAGASA